MAQQSNIQTPEAKTVIQKVETPKSSRINGARQLFPESDVCDPVVSSTTQGLNTVKSRREPPQPPPPPLAPLSNNKSKIIKIENEDSDSTGNNSLASSTGLGNLGLGGVSSTEDGDNSLTSFEGILLNGIPSIDNPLIVNDDSNSKDSLKNAINTNVISKNRPLRLADLLEKKIEKELPILNGVVGKELRIGDKGLELVENHIEKVLSKEPNTTEDVPMENADESEKLTLKRSANDDIVESDPKKPHLVATNLNGNADSPAPDSVSSSNGDEGATSTVSTAAAKLFADIAADILEDEEEEMMHETQPTLSEENVQVPQNSAVPQVFVDNNQQVLVTQPRQIIVSQPQIQTSNQVVIPAGAQLKTQGGQTVIVQNSSQQRAPVVIQQNTGPLLLSSGQMQLVASTSQPGQYVLQTGTAQGAYVVAQSQTAVVHGQPQTVLVTQTPQQQGTPAKTIIILQQQPAPNTAATHHQKVVVTPQGQQVVVTQVQRPLLQSSSVSNNISTSTVIKTSGTTIVTQSSASNGVAFIERKLEEPKPPPKPKIIRDLTTPFVCEWGDCQM